MSHPHQHAPADQRIPDGRSDALLRKLFLFLLAGLPALLIAVPLNWFLVSRAGVPKPAAYALVLALQVTINFFLCRAFVFKPEPAANLWRQFSIFFAGIMGFRILDWALYTCLVEFFHFPFLAVQLGNVLFFAILKFAFAKRTIEGPGMSVERRASRDEGFE